MLKKENMANLGSEKPLLFALLTLAGTAIAWFAYFITHGSAFAGYFVLDPDNTGMDYFNQLALLHDSNPYGAHTPNYPAMCFLVWRVLYHFMPGIPQGGDGLYLRDYMLAQLPYILYTVVCVLIIAICVRHLLRTLKTGSANAVVVALLVSGPLIFTVERGNIILLSLAALMLFVSFYDSEKRWVRYLSYVCLAFSAAIKIYPAIFALLVLFKRRRKEFMHLVVIGAVMFVAPFFTFGGVEAVKTMIEGLFSWSQFSDSKGLGYNFSFATLIKLLASFVGVTLQSVPSLLSVVPLAICLLLLFACKATWQKIFLLGLACVWVPSFSYTYVLIFFIPAVALFLVEPLATKRDYAYLGLFVLLFIPYALPDVAAVSAVRGGVGTGLPWGCLIINLVLVAFAALLAIDAGLSQRSSKASEIPQNGFPARNHVESQEAAVNQAPDSLIGDAGSQQKNDVDANILEEKGAESKAQGFAQG